MNNRQIIIGNRDTGKTYQMIKWLKEAPEGENRMCVVIHEDEARHLRKRNPDLKEWQFISLNAFMRGHFVGWENCVLGIDNVLHILQDLLHGTRIGMVTVEGDGAQMLSPRAIEGEE